MRRHPVRAARPGCSRTRTRGWALIAALAALAPSRLVQAITPDEAIADAQHTLGSVDGSAGEIEKAIANSKLAERTAEARLADGELLFRSKDYERATIVFNEVMDQFPQHPTVYADATYLLGETYFESKQYLSARRTFRLVVDHASDRRFAPYQARALGRLVDVALRVRDYAALDDVFAKINQLPPSSVEAGLSYARGKGLIAKKDYSGARTALSLVNPRSEYYQQAKYLLGVVAIREAPAPPPPVKGQQQVPSRTRFAAAVEAFRQVTALQPDTPEHRHVIDLAWMAIGRLYYESDQFLEAADAYNHVDRGSPEFGTMLYELAWVYVRLGDADRSQRSLEVLAVADPDNSYIADGSLLRADLMLRAGQFEKSLNLYRTVHDQFDPMRAKVEAFLGSTSDPAVYYDKLSKEQLEALDQSAILPPVAIQWAREAEDGPAAFAVIDNVKQCRDLLKHSAALVDKLTALVDAPNRVRAFPELKAGEEKALSLLNAISMARNSLATGLDGLLDDKLSGDMDRVHAERKRLQERLQYIPVTEGDFASREEAAQHQWNGVSRRVQELQLQIDELAAIINGLRRTLAEATTQGVVRDPTSAKAFEAELVQNEHDLALYRAEVAELRKTIDAGKIQVGFGDQRFVDDADTRKAFRRVLAEEARLAAAGAGGRKAVDYAARIIPVLAQADAADARLEAALVEIEARVGKRAGELKATIERESAAIARYTIELEGLDSESRLVVGQVAMRNFGLVRDRLKNIVLRADVGVTEEAWELREEQMTRVRNLQVERARSEQQLNEELREVLDDMGDADTKPAAGEKK